MNRPKKYKLGKLTFGAGDFRKRATLQVKTRARDSQGNYTVTWQTQATVWASVTYLTGNELIAAKQVQADVSSRILIWWRRDVRSGNWRIMFGNNRYLDIHAVMNPEERNLILELLCGETK